MFQSPSLARCPGRLIETVNLKIIDCRKILLFRPLYTTFPLSHYLIIHLGAIRMSNPHTVVILCLKHFPCSAILLHNDTLCCTKITVLFHIYWLLFFFFSTGSNAKIENQFKHSAPVLREREYLYFFLRYGAIFIISKL